MGEKRSFARLLIDHRAIFAVAWIAFVTSAGLFFWFGINQQFATDFSVYWRTANEPVWAAYASRDSLPFPYAPTMLLWIWPLRGANFHFAYVLWVGCSIWLFAFSNGRYLTKAQLILVLVCPVTINCLITGQVSVMLAGLLLIACGTRNRFIAGIIFGIVAGIKPQLVLTAPFFLFRRADWIAFWAAAATFACQIAITLLLFGNAIWVEWIASLDQFQRVLIANNVLGVGVTPTAAAKHLDVPTIPVMIIGSAAAIWVSTRNWDKNPVRDCAIIVCSSLLAAPYALAYDLTALVPYLVVGCFAGSMACAVAYAGTLNPLPLVIAVCRFFRDH